MPDGRIGIVVRQAFRYQGQVYQPGDRLSVKPLEAAAFTNQGKARFARRDELATEAGPSKRTYKRRDLAAE